VLAAALPEADPKQVAFCGLTFKVKAPPELTVTFATVEQPASDVTVTL
jgi:hypothetical protein